MGRKSCPAGGGFLCNKCIKKGEKALIIGPTTGVIEITIGEMRVDNKVVEEVHRGESFSIIVPCKTRPSDKLYVMVDSREVVKQQ